MGQLLRLISIIFAAAVAFAACNSAGCYENGSSIPLAGFYSSRTGSAISVDSMVITGIGAPEDSAILRLAAGRASQVYLPMRPSADQVAWMIEYKQIALDTYLLNDTIRIGYQPIAYFASQECGAMYAYRIRSLSTTHHVIDSVTVIDSLVTNIDQESIKIYFRTGEGDAQ